ncbi:MAG: cobamide remodeling phosphodiesterase CbiR [Desulfobacterales bacterium]|jgi:sugar phosphate isomerase/epimerase
MVSKSSPSDPARTKSYRGRFPFRVATTSFIYPDRIAPNVRALSQVVDEVEVLLFEKDSPPSPEEISEVAAILAESDLTVNVHLPLDAELAAEDPGRRRADARLLRRRIEETLAWRPTSYCLHITPAPRDPTRAALDRWRRAAAESLDRLLRGPAAPEKIAVETLDYPFDRVAPLVEALGLSVCVDLGHLFVHGFDPIALFERHANRIAVVHLHGVADGRDHLSLDRMAPGFLPVVRQILQGYRGVVSIEVFSREALEASLAFLEKIAPPAKGRGHEAGGGPGEGS